MSQSFEFLSETVGDVIRRYFLEVPEYQRPYSWTEEQVDELLDDLAFAVYQAPTAREYFLGSIVVQSNDLANPNSFTIVDGQQRLATVSLMLSALCDFFVKRDANYDAESVRQYLGEWDPQHRTHRAKIKLSDRDHLTYKTLTFPDEPGTSPSPKQQLRKSQKLLIQAKTRTALRVENIAREFVDPIEGLNRLFLFVRNNLKVVTVKVSSSANAYRVFETLNDRGLDLASVDLIKNYLFSQAEEHLQDAQKRWSEIFRTLESISTEKQHRTFLWDYWKSSRGLVREKRLYDDIADNIKTPKDVISFLTDLSYGLDHFAAILNRSHSYWNQFSDCPNQFVEPLLLLRIRQNRPLLFAILSKFERRQIRSALKLVLDAGVRCNVTRELGSQVLERGYAETAASVSNGRIRNATELQRQLETFIPNDSRFREEFSICRVKEQLARYYLSELEIIATGSETMRASSDTTAVNLEHIAPKDGGEDLDEESSGAVQRRLGNYALLEATTNSKLGNQGFSKKKPAYKESQFTLTAEISVNSDWGEAEVDDRQKRLALLALKAWPMQVS